MNSWEMYQCGICDEKFTGKKVLLDHLFDHNKPKHVECPICHIFISTKAILENHCKLVHGRKFEDFSRKIMLEEKGPEGARGGRALRQLAQGGRGGLRRRRGRVDVGDARRVCEGVKGQRSMCPPFDRNPVDP